MIIIDEVVIIILALTFIEKTSDGKSLGQAQRGGEKSSKAH